MPVDAAAAKPQRTLVDILDAGAVGAFLVSDAARRITGTIIPLDGRQHLTAKRSPGAGEVGTEGKPVSC
jgi:enoyl-[acyl-carrier-protein] reductase (NADH)